MVQKLVESGNFRKMKGLRRMLSEDSVNSSTVDFSAGLKQHGITGVDDKLIHELEEDHAEESIVEKEMEKLTEDFDLRAVTWRQRMVHFLHKIPVEIFILTLVVLDVLFVLGMVVLDMFILQEELHYQHIKSEQVLAFHRSECKGVNASILNVTTIEGAYDAILKWNDSYIEGDVNRKKVISMYTAHFNTKHDYDIADMIYLITKVNHILHFGSVTILSIFVLEVILKIIGYGLNFFKNKWEMIDAVVVIISFSLDIAITDATFSHEVGKVILVCFLIWRVIRILNAIILTSRARIMFRLRVLKKSKRLVDSKNRDLETEIADLQAEINELRSLAHTYGADEQEVRAASVLSKSTEAVTKAKIKTLVQQMLSIRSLYDSTNSLAKADRASNRRKSEISNISVISTDRPRMRTRRPTLIGDQALCHDIHAERQNVAEVKMRQKSIGDTGDAKLFNKLEAIRERRRSSPARRRHSTTDAMPSSISQIEKRESTIDRKQRDMKQKESPKEEKFCYDNKVEISESESESAYDDVSVSSSSEGQSFDVVNEKTTCSCNCKAKQVKKAKSNDKKDNNLSRE